MVSDQIRRDLSRNLQNQLAETFERHLKIAAAVLNSRQMGELMFEAAVMMMRSSAASIATMAEGEQDVAVLYDGIIQSMFAAERAGRKGALARALARNGRPI